MAVLKNKTDNPVALGHVTLNPHQQLTVHPPYSQEISDALDAGTVELIDDTPTQAELEADVKAINEGVAAEQKIMKGI